MKSIAIKALLGLPIILGLVFGNLFNSFTFGFGVAAVLYVLVLIQYVRKQKAQFSPGSVQLLSWEKRTNVVLDGNGYILLTPMVPGLFIFVLFNIFANSTVSLVLSVLAIAAAYYFLFNILNGLTAKGGAVSRICSACGFQIQDGASFCARCGTAFKPAETVEDAKKPVICSVCGTELPSGTKFCSLCGTEIHD
ncbi:MAG: zinc ribbon domain-containing protein [Clostridiales bacterium]|jgi:hypothetical protein|nr:zinc ribbon domain-containing protein [Clostridiales bacterium]